MYDRLGEMDDFALALKLQEEFDREAAQFVSNGEPAFSTVGATDDLLCEQEVVSWEKRNELSLVDPQWEVLDPNPDIRSLFLEFNDRFFWGKLSGIEVKWSPRMTLCAGLCVYEGRGGLCSVRLSMPLLKLRPRKDLIETLLHEMIHAYLFVTDNNKDHDGHGPEFHKHMYRLNKATGTNISVYHTFHDEVDSYRQHWWRCDGPCRSRPPYFGYVKRAMNRPPSARDPWWPQHQQTCGGTYTKVKEPEGYGEKNKKKKEKQKEPEKSKGAQDIRKLFGGKGVSLGGGSLVKESTSSRSDAESADAKPGQSGRPDLPQLPSNTLGDFDATLFVSDSDDDYSSWDVPEKDKNSEISHENDSKEYTSTFGIFEEDKQHNSANKTNETTTSKGQPIESENETNAACKPGELADVRVRKLPGIGIITSNRPGSSQTSEQKSSDSRQEIQSKFDSSSTVSPDALNENEQGGVRNVTNNKTEGGTHANEKPKGFVGIKHKGSLRDWLKDPRSEHPPPGTRVRIPGFTSVSNKNSSPANLNATKQETTNATKRYGEPKATGVATYNLAADRNARAHALSDSDNSTDDEESQPLRSAIKKCENVNQMPDKKRHLSNPTDSTFVPKCKRAKTEVYSGSNSMGSDCSIQRVEGSSSRQDSVPGGVPSIPSTYQDVSADSLQTCPVCQTRVKASEINEHLDLCLS